MSILKKKCKGCGLVFLPFDILEPLKCPKCGGSDLTDVEEGSPSIHGGEFSAFAKLGKGYWETLGEPDDPDAYIESEEQLKKVCEKKGVISPYLENKEKHSKKAKE